MIDLLAFAHGLPVLGVSTLEATAEEAGAPRVVACLDARMREVYYAALEKRERRWHEVIAAQCVAPAEAPSAPGEGWVGAGSGFAMYGQSNPGGFIYATTNWIGILFGGMPVVRFIHHVLTWAFLIFIPIHLYLAIRADHLERTGVISSIISGGRFVPANEKFLDGEDA